ncbi:MAG: hypothetical protein LBE44_09640 [Microbacterium hominis]|nr:hypothetical protein [Microbacterium hominis]
MGIIFKTGRNARGRAGKKQAKARNARESKEQKENQNPEAQVWYPYQARPNQKLLGGGKEKKNQKTMHECNRNEYAISKRKEIKAW